MSDPLAPVAVEVDVEALTRRPGCLRSRLREMPEYGGKPDRHGLAEYVDNLLAERDELAEAYNRAPNYRWQAGFWRIVAAVETAILAGIAIALWASRS